MPKGVYERTELTKTNLKAAQPKGEDSVHWKGNGIGYGGIHSWIGRKHGKANSCSLQDETCKGGFEWANISGAYNRNIDDFAQLCHSHHVRFDRRNYKDRRNEWTKNLRTG